MPSVSQLAAVLRQVRRPSPAELAVARDTTPPPPRAYAGFGAGSVVVPPARVVTPHCIRIGEGVQILEHSLLAVRHLEADAPELVIGDRVRLGRFFAVACVRSIVIEDDVMASDDVFIADTFHSYEDVTTPIEHQPMAPGDPVVIRRGAYLGAGSSVLGGVTVGEGAYVGEGAVVNRDVPRRTLVVGSPARVLRNLDDISPS